MTMRVLVTFATPQEFAPWKALRQFLPVEIGPLTVYDTRIGDAEVRVGLTGIGQMPAVRAARELLQLSPDFCISTGTAGGLRPQHQIGRVLVARALRMEDDRFLIKSDDRLRRMAAVCGARVVDLFFSADHVVITAREKAALGLLADAVEMESYAVLTEASRCRVPAVAIRAVSDGVRADLPLDFNRAITRQGGLSWPRLFALMARRPYRLPGLVRMGGESRRAAASLARFLDLYLQTLAGQITERELLARAQRSEGRAAAR
jgi:nucleoside phosphorylase